MPAHRRCFDLKWQKIDKECDSDENSRLLEKVQQHYNQKAKDLPELSAGNCVSVRDPVTKLWTQYGIIVGTASNRRYLVRMNSGRVLCRNRKFIRRRWAHTTPGDLATGEVQGTGEQQTARPAVAEKPSGGGEQVPLRRSQRIRRRPARLIEEI